jgi:hypothetical protein
MRIPGKSALFTTALVMVCLFDAYVLLYLRQLPSLDARLYYSYADIQRLFLDLGTRGRALYFSEEIYDLTFLTSYTILIVQAVQGLFRRRQIDFTRATLFFCAVPGFFDLIETSGIMVLLKRWPDLGYYLPHIVQLATPLKWGTGFVLLIYVIAKIGFKRPQTVQRPGG